MCKCFIIGKFFLYITYLLLCTVIQTNSFAYYMCGITDATVTSNDCLISMNPGTQNIVTHGFISSTPNTKLIKTFIIARNSTSLSSGAIYLPGETLSFTVTIIDTTYQLAVTSDTARFVGGFCSNANRIYPIDNSYTVSGKVIMPSTGNVKIWADFSNGATIFPSPYFNLVPVPGPTVQPSFAPTSPTIVPTSPKPTFTSVPTGEASFLGSDPTLEPSIRSIIPSRKPTRRPSRTPTIEPTAKPTYETSDFVTQPSRHPTRRPSRHPTNSPTVASPATLPTNSQGSSASSSSGNKASYVGAVYGGAIGGVIVLIIVLCVLGRQCDRKKEDSTSDQVDPETTVVPPNSQPSLRSLMISSIKSSGGDSNTSKRVFRMLGMSMSSEIPFSVDYLASSEEEKIRKDGIQLKSSPSSNLLPRSPSVGIFVPSVVGTRVPLVMESQESQDWGIGESRITMSVDKVYSD